MSTGALPHAVGLLESQAPAMPSISRAPRPLRKRRSCVAVMKKFDADRDPKRDSSTIRHSGSDPARRGQTPIPCCHSPSSSGTAARSAGVVANQGAKTIVRPGAACARASLQASASVSCTATLARPAAASASARRGPAGPKRAACTQAVGGHRRCALELLALLGRGVHRARRPGRRSRRRSGRPSRARAGPARRRPWRASRRARRG